MKQLMKSFYRLKGSGNAGKVRTTRNGYTSYDAVYIIEILERSRVLDDAKDSLQV